MFQQYMHQAQTAIAYLSTDELKELINDDEKLEERVNDVVGSVIRCTQTYNIDFCNKKKLSKNCVVILLHDVMQRQPQNKIKIFCAFSFFSLVEKHRSRKGCDNKSKFKFGR